MPTKTPRTINAVRNTINQLNRYDKLYAQAESKGDIKKMAQYEQALYHLDALVANVSDRVWVKYTTAEETA